MIQFNLLPDVKMQYIKSKKLKRTIMLFSSLATGLALVVLISLFVIVNFIQKERISDLNNDITKYTNELKAIPDLDKILTIQNQLTSLPQLHDDKVVAERMLGYATQVTPAQASIEDLKVDFANNIITISGAADSLNTINRFADTLKFTTFQTKDESLDGNAFSEVVLTTFAQSEKNVTYQIDLKFDPAIFDSSSEVALTVPSIISTRSETQKPTALFQQTPNTTEGTQ